MDQVPKSRFVGVDLAGDSGDSGVAVLEIRGDTRRYWFPDDDWRGLEGLQRMSELVATATLVAVDQPFSYPRSTMRLLLDGPGAAGGEDSASYSTRVTDAAMRRSLTRLGLSTNYVMSPNRCQNIWRALALAKLCGLSRQDVCACTARIIETHPRVSWAHLLAKMAPDQLKRTVVEFKGTDDHANEVLVRKEMLRAFEKGTGFRPRGQTDQERALVQDQACGSSDALEALICGFVAYLHSRAETKLAGFEDSREPPEELLLEGAAVIPAVAWPPGLGNGIA